MTNISDWLETWTGDHCDSEGGGGGDIPQWHVTINTVDMGEDDYLGCYYVTDNDVIQLAALVDGKPCVFTSYTLDGTTKTVDIGVWDNTATIALYIRSLEAYYTVSVTGNVEFVDDEGWNFYITGDGTITFTAI